MTTASVAIADDVDDFGDEVDLSSSSASRAVETSAGAC